MRRSWIARSEKPLRRSSFMRKTTSSFSTIRTVKDTRARRLNPVGKKGRDWIAVRRQLSAEFAAQCITSCELRLDGCWGDKALGYAHGRKRRHLKGDELKTLTALLCNPCHDRIEYLPAAEMLAIVESIITNRKVAA